MRVVAFLIFPIHLCMGMWNTFVAVMLSSIVGGVFNSTVLTDNIVISLAKSDGRNLGYNYSCCHGSSKERMSNTLKEVSELSQFL